MLETDPEAEDRRARALAEFVRRLQRGEPIDLDSVGAASGCCDAELTDALALARSVACPTARSVPSVPGYRAIRPLGAGGSGAVWLAHQESLGREVALKVLSIDETSTVTSRERFLAEARTLASIRAPGIVAVHDVIEQSDTIAIAMDRIAGPSLRDVLRGEIPRPGWSVWVVRSGIRVARALAVVHAAGLVHRDVKPDNLLVDRDGEVVLTDFGLAHAVRSPQGGFAGTRAYAAPEQRSGEGPVDGRADIFALGATLFELLAHTSPSDLDASPRPCLRALNREVSRDLETVIHKALEFEPTRRYASASEFADDLQRVLELQPVLARPPGPVGRLVRFVRRNRRTALAALVAGAATALLSLVVVLGGRRSGENFARAHALVARAQARLLDAGVAAPDRSARLVALLDAVTNYDAALELLDDKAARRDREVTALAAALLDAERGVISQSLAAELEPGGRRAEGVLDALVRAAALRWLRDGSLRVRRSQLEPESSRLLGLLAFLLQDLATCEEHWGDLDLLGTDAPLAAACLGLLHLADGRPERALPELLQAAQTFRAHRALAQAIAECAFELEDRALLRGIHAQLSKHVASHDAGLRRVRADLLALDGRLAEARVEYEALSAAAPLDPGLRIRLAALALRQERPLDALTWLERGPTGFVDTVAARLLLARAAAALRDEGRQLRVARWAFLRAASGSRTAAEIASCASILRACDLDRLAARIERRARPTGPNELRELLVERLAWFDADPSPSRALAAGPEALVVVGGVPGLGLALSVAIWQRCRGDLPSEWLPRALLAAESFVPHGRASCSSSVAVAREAELDRTRLALIVDDEAAPILLAPFAAEQAGPRSARGVSRLGSAVRSVVRAVRPASEAPLSAARYSFGVSAIAADSGRAILLAIADAGRTPDSIRCIDTRTLAPRWVAAAGQGLVWSVAECGDHDGDGIADFVVGEPLPEQPLRQTPSARVLSGRDGSDLMHWTGPSDAFAAFTVANLGDLDGDGNDELAFGCPHRRDRQGLVRIVTPRTGTTLGEVLAPDGSPDFGSVIERVGDLDGDGCRDFVVGEVSGLRTATRAQTIVVAYSARTRLPIWIARGTASGDEFGAACCGLLDLDGDGLAELLIGAPGAGLGRRGEVHLVAGASGITLHVWRGDSPDARLGRALAVGNGSGARPPSAYSVARDVSGQLAIQLLSLPSLASPR